MDDLLTGKLRRFDFKMCGVVLFYSQFDNIVLVNGNMFLVKGSMFCVNGKLFLGNGKSFMNKSHIP